jgi:hypothetical protein
MFSFVCSAQTSSIIKKDSSKYIFNSYNLFSFNSNENKPIPALNYAFKMDNKLPSFISINSSHIPQYTYDNSKHEYFLSDPVYPYHSFGSSLLNGSLNYLFLLIENNK